MLPRLVCFSHWVGRLLAVDRQLLAFRGVKCNAILIALRTWHRRLATSVPRYSLVRWLLCFRTVSLLIVHQRAWNREPREKSIGQIVAPGTGSKDNCELIRPRSTLVFAFVRGRKKGPCRFHATHREFRLLSRRSDLNESFSELHSSWKKLRCAVLHFSPFFYSLMRYVLWIVNIPMAEDRDDSCFYFAK